MDIAEIIVFGIGLLIVAVSGALYTSHSSPVVRTLSAGVGIGMLMAGILTVLFLTLIEVL